MEDILGNMRREKHTLLDSSLPEVQGLGVSVSKAGDNEGAREAGGQPSPDREGVRNESRGSHALSFSRRSSKRKKGHAVRWDDKPCYYDKSFNPARSRAESPELKQFLEEERNKEPWK